MTTAAEHGFPSVVEFKIDEDSSASLISFATMLARAGGVAVVKESEHAALLGKTLVVSVAADADVEHPDTEITYELK